MRLVFSTCFSVYKSEEEHLLVFELLHPNTKNTCIIVDPDMVWKLGKLQSAYNELRFDVETVLPCTNLLFFAY